MENITTPEEYSKAIATLVSIAQQDFGGSRAAAQVLLSAYNGSAFQLDVTDLCILDCENFEAAMTVIRGRKELMREPHQMIPNGDLLFSNLWDQWICLHVEERGKRDCPDCDGRGKTRASIDDDLPTIKCNRCNGSGRVCRCGN